MLTSRVEMITSKINWINMTSHFKRSNTYFQNKLDSWIRLQKYTGIAIIYFFLLRPDGRKGTYYRKLMFCTRRDQNIVLPPQRDQHIVFCSFSINQWPVCGTKKRYFLSRWDQKWTFSIPEVSKILFWILTKGPKNGVCLPRETNT